MANQDSNHRRHIRCEAFTTVVVDINGKKVKGSLTNLSISGAAIELEVELKGELPPGGRMTLDIDGVGKMPAKLVRTVKNSIATELLVGPKEKDRLAARLMGVINDIPPE